MYRQEAMEQFEYAFKQGQKYYHNAVIRGEYPYPQVLDEVFKEEFCSGRANIGLVDIPMDQIVGTTTAGRKSAFAGNFMPLLKMDSEFGEKWVNLCAAHLDSVGITDPIICNEYMGRFYVTEGNKRVSVMKSYDAATIPGYVTRIIPSYSDNPDVRIYYEFMDFYRLSKLYEISFRRVGGFAKLQAALGYAPDHKWTEDERKDFLAAYRKLRPAFDKLNTEKLPLAAGDVLLVWLEVYPLSDLETITAAELNKRLTALWQDLRILAAGSQIEVSTAPEEGEKGGLLRSLGIGKVNHLKVAFVHSFDPAKSAWTAAHDLGRQHLEKVLGDRLTITSHVCSVADAEDVMEKAVADGVQVIFTTTPPLIDACRKIAVRHPNVRALNCSLSMPYAGVRTYYSRMYEGKFITGAIAGAMAAEDRIGYIANYPIAGTLAAINAFALGVRMTNPRAKVKLRWSCLPGDHAGDFMREGIDVISNRDNAAGESHYAWEWGTYQVGENRELTPLASPCWDWGQMYERIIRSIFNGTWDSTHSKSDAHAVNYWWGMSSGVVSVDFSPVLPDGIRQMAEILRQGISSGALEPFRCAIRDQQGVVRNDGTRWLSPEELMTMDWLCDNVEGSVPAYEELLPASRPLVRQLGLNRDQLPPETEVAP